MAALLLTRQEFTKKENVLLFVCSEAVESKLVKLETSHSTMMLPPKVSVLSIHHFLRYYCQHEQATLALPIQGWLKSSLCHSSLRSHFKGN